MDKTAAKEAGMPVLTLKNVYRLLTRRDYPSPSYRVFPEETLRNVSLMPFWYALFTEVFSDACDFSLLDVSSSRNRTANRLMNRSGAAGMLSRWFSALSDHLDSGLFTRLVRAWTERLTNGKYDAPALSVRLRQYFEIILDRHDLETEELEQFFRELAGSLDAPAGESAQCPLDFRHSVLLSWLTLYALYGSRMGDAGLKRLRASCGVPAEVLYSRFQQETSGPAVEIISARRCVLCIQPLAEDAYFGYRDKMETALKRFLQGPEKAVVLGIGGVGKTEFVRQLLARLVGQNLYGRIAFVQYSRNLESSFTAAFPGLRNLPPEERISHARKLLEKKGTRTLLLIDGADNMNNRDPALWELGEYGCDILITSRYAVPPGFSTISLRGLSPEEGRALFMYHCRNRQAFPETVDAVCQMVGCHPLAVTLLANLCRVRFWAPERLADHMRAHGLSRLSYVRQASPVNLEGILAETFTLSDLETGQARLVRLFSLLPYRFWLPEDLMPYAADLYDNPDSLADGCQVLCDLGWLQRGDDGFSVHPLIAQVSLLEPVHASDYPRLWDYIDAGCCSADDLVNQALVFLILRTAEPDLRAIRCLSRLETHIGYISYFPLFSELYDLHRRFLDEHPHDPPDETDYWLGLCFRDIVVFSRIDRLNAYLDKITAAGPRSVRSMNALYTVLEHASALSDLSVTDRVFSRIRPVNAESVEMADYLISWSVRQRRGGHDPEAALSSLQQADGLLMRLQMSESLRQSDLDYRMAVCLLDLSRPKEALPRLERSLRLLEKSGVPEDAAKVISTRSTYAVILCFLGEFGEALRVYEALRILYRKQGRDHSAEYAMMRNNTAVALLSAGRIEEARETILEVLTADENLTLAADILATHHRNAALILARCGETEAGYPHAEKAYALRRDCFGADSPWTADASAVWALLKARTEGKETALPMIREACEILKNSWGEGHRHTRNALEILGEIL